MPGPVHIKRAEADAKLRKRRKDAAKILAELRRLPVVWPGLSDDDLYDANGLPK